MKKKLYQVSHSDYEDYSPVLLYGPEQKDWKKYCEKLIPLAVKNIFKARRESKDKWDWIGYNNIIEEIVKILIQRGYEELRPEEFVLSGGTIINRESKADRLPKSVRELVIKYNQIMDTAIHVYNKEKKKDEYDMSKGDPYVIEYEEKGEYHLAGVLWAESEEEAKEVFMKKTHWGKILINSTVRVTMDKSFEKVAKLIK